MRGTPDMLFDANLYAAMNTFGEKADEKKLPRLLRPHLPP